MPHEELKSYDLGYSSGEYLGFGGSVLEAMLSLGLMVRSRKKCINVYMLLILLKPKVKERIPKITIIMPQDQEDMQVVSYCSRFHDE